MPREPKVEVANCSHSHRSQGESLASLVLISPHTVFQLCFAYRIPNTSSHGIHCGWKRSHGWVIQSCDITLAPLGSPLGGGDQPIQSDFKKISLKRQSAVCRWFLWNYDKMLKMAAEVSTPWWGRNVVWHTWLIVRTTTTRWHERTQ